MQEQDSLYSQHISEPENTKNNTESELILYIQIHFHNPNCTALINRIWRALSLLCVDGVILLLRMLVWQQLVTIWGWI